MAPVTLPAEIIQRDDGLYDVVSGETTAGPFPTRAFALSVAGDGSAPLSVTKYRRIKAKRCWINLADLAAGSS
jgi:hypothetical protein